MSRSANHRVGPAAEDLENTRGLTRYLLEHETERTCTHEDAPGHYDERRGWTCSACSAPYRVKGLEQHALKAAYQQERARSLVSTPPPSTEDQHERAQDQQHRTQQEREQRNAGASMSNDARTLTHEDRAQLDARAAAALVDTLDALDALRHIAVEPAAALAVADRAIKAAKELHAIAQGGPGAASTSSSATVHGVSLSS